MGASSMLAEVNWRSGTFWRIQALLPLVFQRIPWSTAHPLVNGKWDEVHGGGARFLSFLKLSFLYIGAIDFVNIRTQPSTAMDICFWPLLRWMLYDLLINETSPRGFLTNKTGVATGNEIALIKILVKFSSRIFSKPGILFGTLSTKVHILVVCFLWIWFYDHKIGVVVTRLLFFKKQLEEFIKFRGVIWQPDRYVVYISMFIRRLSKKPKTILPLYML